jgi:phosphoribosyl 1,2-cyclic phosphodiesterase
MILELWGTRGSIPTPGESTKKYGGNTSCIALRMQDKYWIIDAGSGLRSLGIEAKKEFGNKRTHINMLISHTHWDHIQGFPFFLPFYIPNFSFTIHGGIGLDGDLEHLLMNQMDSNYFPVNLGELAAKFEFVNLMGEPTTIDGVKVSTHYLNHPGMALGFRIEYQNKVFVYATDNEPYVEMFKLKNAIHNAEDLAFSQSLENKYLEFVEGADLLLADAQYTREEYPNFIGFGHSFMEYAIENAHKAKVKKLLLFHHDPMHTDEFIDEAFVRMQRLADKKYPEVDLLIAKEGDKIEF